MKKVLSLLTLVMFFVMTANADNYRRTWDFRKGWSEITKAKLEADPAHWEVQGTGFQNYVAMSKGTAVVYVDGVAEEIPELKGLKLNGLGSAKHVQIVTTYSGIKDVPCLWINGKNSGTDEVSFTVPAGENVKFGYTAHGAQDRGFSVVGSGFADIDGKTKFTNADNTVIHEVELINTNTEDADCMLRAANGGSHIYYIIIGDGDAPKSSKVGLVYYEAAGQGFEELPLYTALKDMENVTIEGVKVDDANPTKEQLSAYDAIVLDGSLPADAELVASLKDLVQWQPTFSVNANLAEAFGYAEKVVLSEDDVCEMGTILDPKKSWFTDFEGADPTSNSYGLTNGEVMPVPLRLIGSHASEKNYIAWQDANEGNHVDSVLAYVHNAGHNQYAYYGAYADFTEGTEIILQNMLMDCVGSKSDIEPVSKPSFKPAYKEMESTIAISNVNKNAVIYYTTDGTDPTVESPVYTEPLVFTEEVTVKAVAIAEGYTLSDVASFDVKLYHQAKTPVISVAGDPATEDAVITISSDEEGVALWYNFSGSNDIKKSSKYTEAITMKRKGTVTAFAVASSEESALVQSEVATKDFEANMTKVRRDEVAHFTGSGWNTLANLVLDNEPQAAWASSNYYFSWGKTAQPSYTQSEDPELDEEGNPVLDQNGEPTFTKIPKDPSTTACTTDEDWIIKSAGQVMIYQGNTLSTTIGDFNGYNPAHAEDIVENLATTAAIQFGGVASGDKATAMIVSTKKYQAPLNVVTVIANANGDKTSGVGNTNAKAQVEVSADGVTWTAVGEEYTSSEIYRNYKTTEVAYEGTDEVYVRLVSVSGSGQNVHDIYVFNHGEKSIAEEDEYTQAVSVVEQVVKVAKAVKFFKDGRIVIVKDGKQFNAAGAQVK